MKPARVVSLVVGCLLAVASLGLLVAGGAVGWAYGTQRDDSGFFTSSTERLETVTAALTSDEVRLGADPGPRWVSGNLATVRLDARSAEGRDLFVGIGPSREVEAYLADVAHDEVRSIDADPFRATYRRDGGEAAVAPPPAGQPFWVASDTGPGTRSVTWDLEQGRWAAVVMNADGSRPVSVDVTVGARSDLVLPIAIGLGVAGGVLLLLSAVLIVLGVHGHAAHPAGAVAGAEAVGAAAGSGTPVAVRGRLDPNLSRWLWLVKWLLVVPHVIVLVFLWAAFAVLTLVAGVAILVSGRYPRRIFEFNVGVLRWSWRVGYYATSVLGTDRYPPFTLGPVPDYPATLDIAYPQHLSRTLVLVKWWLLALPHYLIVAAISGGGQRGAWTLGLGAALVLVVAGTLLFTGRYPQGLFDLLLGLHRWGFRLCAYVALMTDAYPPFRLDQGGDEPGDRTPVPPTPSSPPTESHPLVPAEPATRLADGVPVGVS